MNILASSDSLKLNTFSVITYASKVIKTTWNNWLMRSSAKMFHHIYVMVKIAPSGMADVFAQVGTGVFIANPAGCGYIPANSAVLWLLAKKHL